MSWWKRISSEGEAVAHAAEQEAGRFATDARAAIEELVGAIDKSVVVSVEHSGHFNTDGTGNFAIDIRATKPAPPPEAEEPSDSEERPGPTS